MARRTQRSTRAAELAFDAISIEGGLLAADWLARAAQLKAPQQEAADYGVPKGLELRDEIGRYWRIAQALWVEFETGRKAKAEPNSLTRRFVVSLLREAFGFTDLVERPHSQVESALGDDADEDQRQPFEMEGRAWPLTAIDAAGRVPLVCAPAGAGLDSPHRHLGDEHRKQSAFGLAQDFLNVSVDALWGLCSDGLTLRLVRDNASLTRPAWVEVDLVRIFTEELYPDFAAAWLVLHRSRFGRADQEPESCALETWRSAAQEEGTRARDELRAGVEAALVVLGQGFLSHPDNGALRAKLHDGSLTTDALFGELLRLVYRLIFLLTVEERDLLHLPRTSAEVRERYAQGYSIRRLRDRSARRAAYDRHGDLWDATRIVFRCLAAGEERLGLPALGGLFEPDQCASLDGAKLRNRPLLEAMFRLGWLRTPSGIARVNWRDMGPEELGSVYESLLELVPRIADEGRTFGFAEATQGRATARKESGSYYTPDSLVQALLDVSLEPVIRDVVSKNPQNPARALLGITVVDPACGSGHFLLAAARRIATHLARFRAQGTPSANEYREALRSVVGSCIYGVDLNPMAVELCRVALWMEAIVPGRPLSFLEAHIRHGNALVGATPELLEAGLPDDAWDAVEGDDKPTASRLKKANKNWRQGNLFDAAAWTPSAQLAELSAVVESAGDESLEAVHAKSEAWRDYERHPAVEHATLLADLWCSAFFWPKVPGVAEESAPVRGVWERVKTKPETLPQATRATTNELRARYHFFHWAIAFPQVFARGGFDVVLGNPPWETLSPDAKEFFARWEPQIRFQSKEEQEATIAALVEGPDVAREWDAYRRRLFTWVHFLKKSGRFTMYAPGNLGKGDFNVYRMFVETALRVAREGGAAAQIVPSGLYNGANCSAIRSHMFERTLCTHILGFINAREVWFRGINTTTRFCLYAARPGGSTTAFAAAFAIDSKEAVRRAVSDAPIRIPTSLVREFSPDALAVMEFGSQRDIDIASKMYACWPKLGDAKAGPPHRKYMREIDMGTDRDLFNGEPNGVPLYEGRMVSHYDYRAKGYRSGRGRAAVWAELHFGAPDKGIQPQWYVPVEKIPVKTEARFRQHRVCFGDVAYPETERSMYAAMIPSGVLAGHVLPTITFGEGWEWAALPWLAFANSYCGDWLVRKKVKLHLSFTILDSIPFPRLPVDHSAVAALAPRVLRLTCTGPEMTPFWNDMAQHGWVNPVDADVVPGEIDEDARLALLAEIEVIVARDLYGLDPAEVAYVLDTFPIVRERETDRYGEYRTKRLVLEEFSRLPRLERAS